MNVGSWNCRSIGDKAPMLCDCISSNDFDFFAEHDSHTHPCVIASTPNGYRCVEKTRPRTKDNACRLTPNHGGICLFHKSQYMVREISLPTYQSMEVLAVYVQASIIKLTLVIIYRPGSLQPRSTFVEELSDVIERTVVYAAPLILVGDTNVHLDDPQAPQCTSI